MNFAKYSSQGGIGKVAFEVTSGVSTLQAVACKASVSRETVRNDVQTYLGKSEYSLIMHMRRMKARQMHEPIVVDLKAALKELAKSSLPLEKKAELQYWIPKILKASNSAGVHLKLKLFPTRLPELLTAKENPICLRTVHPTGTTPENKMGLHRFKVNQSAEAKPFFLFGICSDRPIFYVFKGTDIHSVRSLVLRYDHLNRGSKYSQGLSNWVLLRD